VTRYKNSKKAKQCLVVVNSAIVYQNMAFSHSLALEATGHSGRLVAGVGLYLWPAPQLGRSACGTFSSLINRSLL
jgi:hypothetical protein